MEELDRSVCQDLKENPVTRAFKESVDPAVLKEIKEKRALKVTLDRQETLGDLERTDQKVLLARQGLWDCLEKRVTKGQGDNLV